VPAPLIVHVTPGFVLFATVAVRPCVCIADSVAVVGETVIETAGFKVIVDVAVFVASAELVAVIVTVDVLAMLEGAV
jgi:hypothetical protein